MDQALLVEQDIAFAFPDAASYVYQPLPRLYMHGVAPANTVLGAIDWMILRLQLLVTLGAFRSIALRHQH
jgi:hypothetical protein